MTNISKLVRDNIRRLTPYSSARHEFDGNAQILLDANENPFGNLNRYPDPYQSELKELLSLKKGVSTSNIFVGNGSDEIIDLLFRIFCNPGIDKAITFSPTYGMYQVSADINDVELIDIPLNDSFQINQEATTDYFKDERVKLLFICSPNNPTGNSLNSTGIEQILKEFNGIVIIDEAYIDFAEQSSFCKRVNEFNNLVVTQTFSKALGLAGARIGTAFCSTEILSLLNRIKPPYNVSSLNQQAAIQALKQDSKQAIDIIISEKQGLQQTLQKLDFVEHVFPSDANFVLIRVSDADKLYHHLLDRGIVIRNRSKQISNCVRISIGTPQENKQLITALKEFE